MTGKGDILKQDISSNVWLLTVAIIGNCLCVPDNTACHFGFVEL